MPIMLIKEKLPTKEKDRRRTDSSKLAITKIRDFLDKLKNRQKDLNDDHLTALREIRNELIDICG